MNNLCDILYDKFQENLVNTAKSVNNYILSEEQYDHQVNFLGKNIKYIHKCRPECFQYIFEKFYSDNKSPFITAYSHFMSHDLDYTELAHCILERYNTELNNDNEFISF
jgi:hypothetical protein